MDILENIRSTFRTGNSLTRLIYINSGIFIGLKIIILILLLFNISGNFILPYLAVPADLTTLLHRPWTIASYMFLHEEVLHILFNMLALFWFGKIFLLYFSERQLVGLYIAGGLISAVFYIAAFNLFPLFAPEVSQSLLLGASGSIMAIIVASAFQSPNIEVQIILLGPVRLKYIAIFTVLTSILGITSNNAGGEIAHLGGALTGYLFIVSLRQGKDLTKGFNRLLDGIANLFKPSVLRVKPNPHRRNGKMTDEEFNMNKARKMAEIDKILDKIKTSGYESLTAEEKKRLFEQGNRN